MTPARLIEDLSHRGHLLAVDEDRIRVTSCRFPLTPKEASLIRDHKSELLLHLAGKDTGEAETLRSAIEQLAVLCPVDLLERLDWKLQQERRRLGLIPLDSVPQIRSWFEGWRILIAEVLVSDANRPDVNGNE